MEVAAGVAEVRASLAQRQRPIGFVPTMGALHEGHLELIRRARLDSATLVASVFVNRLQFGENEDFDRYPRDFARDRDCLREHGVDLVFAPAELSMFAPDFSTSVTAGEMGTRYEGAIRPSHFSGVATVVTKLLNVIHPDVLYLGQKDAQQTAVVRRVIRDLDIPARVSIVPTVREADGLAFSSRNAYLSPEERANAPSLHRALVAMRDAMQSGSSKAHGTSLAREILAENASLDYLDVVDADSFEPIDSLRAPAFVIGAARFGTTRLLDNLWLTP